jgi:hypothetical protein
MSTNRITRTCSGLALAATVTMLPMVSACEVGVGPGYPVGPYGYDYGYPPDAYLATTDPFYWGGRANYWYGGRWNYREGGRWGHYDHEPAGLYQQRMHGPAGRHMYEPGHGEGHSSGRGGRGGGRGGGGRR